MPKEICLCLQLDKSEINEVHIGNKYIYPTNLIKT